MAVKDWLPVAQDIYDVLIADGNPKQELKLKISHKSLCEILSKHNITVTEDMNKLIDLYGREEPVPLLVGVIETTVQNKDLSKSLRSNNLFRGYLTDAEKRFAKSSSNVPKTMWTYQIAHELHLAFKNPKAKEEAIKDDEEIEKAREEIIEDEIKVSEEKENTNEDMGFVETEESSEDSFESTKHDKYIKICSEIVEIRRKLGVISILDLSTIVGKEFFSNGASLFTVPGDKRYIKVLEILNNISSIVNALSLGISLEELVDHVEDQFNELDEIAESFKNSNKDADDKQLFSVLEYLDSIRKANRLKPIGVGTNDLLKAFVIGKIVDNESEFIFLSDNISSRLMMQLCGLINAPNFDINDEVQIDTCKLLISTIKQAVLRNKAANKIGCFVNAGNPFPLPPLPGIDQRIYQKAAAFDKLVEALRPIFDELTN
jgi:hypothetical protein